MPGVPPDSWRPAIRLRMLEGISGRGLLFECSKRDTVLHVHYVTLSACAADCDGSSQPNSRADGWRLIYRSEAVGGTLNPEWRPLAWDERQLLQADALLDSGEVRVLVALHELEWQRPAAPEAASMCEHATLQQPLLFDAASRPALQLPDPGGWLDAAGQQATAADAAAPAAGGALTEASAQAASNTAAVDGAESQPSQQGSEADGGLGVASVKRQTQQRGASPAAEGQQAEPGQPWLDGNGVQQGSVAACHPASRADRPAPCSEAAGTPPQHAQPWHEAAAAALAGTGCCPGRLVTAWHLGSLDDLFPAGADLASLHLPLQLHTLVLHLGGGAYLCPPPLQQPASQQASPLKMASGHAATVGRVDARGEGSALVAPPGPTRRLANLLVSKLLRSTPNLQDPGVFGGLEAPDAGSDWESDAESEAATTTATGASLPSTITGSSAAGAEAAVGVPSSSGGGVMAKPLTLAGAHQYIASLAALRGRLRDLAGCSQALQEQLGRRLEPRWQRQRQERVLAALHAGAAHCRRQAAEARQEVEEARAAAAAGRKLATVRAQALVTTLKVMQAASRRVGEAEASLGGEAGRWALVSVLRELVARRCQMVCQLGAIWQLGPTAVSIPEAPPGGYLEDRLEQQWAGAATASGFAAAPPWGGGMGGTILDTPSEYRQEMRLSIGGLEVRPAVWRKAFEGGGYERDADEDQAAGVALGYVAQVVDRLAAYLGVLLAYPLLLRGSRSAVVDSYPPAGSWPGEAEEAARRPLLFGRGDAAGSGPGERPALEYPLYCDSNRERPRFAVGVFLLNKDVIQLLQAHGISAAGPNHLLQNLYKLLLAAQSAVPVPRLLQPPTGEQLVPPAAASRWR